MLFDGELMPPGVQLRNQRPPVQDPDAFNAARRRHSNDGDVASRQISRTIGCHSVSVSVELIVSQGKTMCVQYVCDRLKRSGVYHPLFGPELMRCAKLLPHDEVLDEVYPTLAYIGSELERKHPATHTNFAWQIKSGGCFTSEQNIVNSLSYWAKFKYHPDRCNWSDVVSLFAVAGGVAVNCVRQGNREFLPGVIRGVGQVLEKDIGLWIDQNGGWFGLKKCFKAKPKESELLSWKAIYIIGMALFLLYILIVATKAAATEVIIKSLTINVKYG